ncbi:hypothetical protein GN956_G16869 [Arapaima gigas]
MYKFQKLLLLPSAAGGSRPAVTLVTPAANRGPAKRALRWRAGPHSGHHMQALPSHPSPPSPPLHLPSVLHNPQSLLNFKRFMQLCSSDSVALIHARARTS